MSDRSKREQLARYLCKRAGFNPDDTGLVMPMAVINTPAGQVARVQAEWLAPLWIHWVNAAQAMLDFAADGRGAVSESPE